MTEKQQVDTVTPAYLKTLMVGAANKVWEGKMTPDACMALAAAAQAFASLSRVEDLQTKVRMLEQQLVLQRSSVSA